MCYRTTERLGRFQAGSGEGCRSEEWRLPKCGVRSNFGQPTGRFVTRAVARHNTDVQAPTQLRDAGLNPRPLEPHSVLRDDINNLGSLWHCFRRKWATDRKHYPVVDVAAAGGWRDINTLLTCYQQPDADTMRSVMELRPMGEKLAQNSHNSTATRTAPRELTSNSAASYPSCPSWARTRTLLIQSQACCQLHQGAGRDQKAIGSPQRTVELARR